MHKEDTFVTPSKPRTTVRTATIKTDHGSVSVNNHTINLHSRLPSADSGIQDDGGFDSLSRYKGKNFLSTCNDQGATHNTSSTVVSHSSSGYSSDQSQGPLGPKVVSLPSSSLATASKPVPPVKPTLSSSPSKSSSSRPSPRSSATTSSNSPTPSIDTKNVKPVTKGQHSSSESSETSSGNLSDIPRQSGISYRSVYVNQNITPGRPVPAQRTDIGASGTNRKMNAPISTNHKSESEAVGMFPSLTVVAIDSGVELSFSKSAVNVPSSSPSSDISTSSSSATRAAVGLSLDQSEEYGNVTESSSKASGNNIVTVSGSALKLQVIKPSRQGQDHTHKPTNQGQGCIALTRPLRLGTPSKLSVKTVQPTTLHSQPLHLVPIMKPSQQREQRVHQQQAPTDMKAKPKIAPRPSVLSKTITRQSSDVTAIDTFTSSSSTTITGSPSSSVITSSSSNRTVTSSHPPNEPSHKAEVPVVHRIKTSLLQSGRTEIPVTHVVHRAPSYKNQLFTRPPSFVGRHTPERDKVRPQSDQYMRQPIYENLRFDIREGFDFDDEGTRTKQAQLILKHSDELINDALKMLGASTISSLDINDIEPLISSTDFPDGSTPVEGADTSSKREHRIPIYDVRTGKFHSGTRKSYVCEWAEGHGSSANGESKKEVTWKERKGRIDTALTWLKHELADLRDMDNTLIYQFKRCQDTIEALKSQREVWEGLSEEGDEGEYWDDYELNEYNRRYLDSPGGSSSGQFSPGSREPSLQDVTLISLPVPQLSLPQNKKATNGQHGVKQDIEVTL